MRVPCPECGAVAEVPEGRTAACRGCGNPVLAATAPPARAQRPAAPEEATPAPRGPGWGGVGIALAALAVLHVGAYLLLTAGARADVAEAEERFTEGEMEAALAAPSDARLPDDPRAAQRVRELRERAGAWDDDRRHVSFVRTGLVLAFLAQAVFVLWIRWRAEPRPARRRDG